MNIDSTKLTAEQRDKLDLYNMAKEQADTIKSLQQKMDNFTPEMQMKISNLADLKQDLTPILDALKGLADKEQPDSTTPIVEAVDRLQKALGAIDFKPSFKPEVKVDAPTVTVSAPPVDLSGVEKAVKDVSQALKEAIASIPAVEIPETDFSPLLDKLDTVLKQLSDIDTGVRLKPEPGTMKVTHPDGTTIGSTVIPDELAFASFVAAGDNIIVPVIDGMSGWTMAYYGTYATGASLTMEASFDNDNTYSTVRMLAGSTSTLGYVLTIAAVSNSTAYFVADIPNGATHLRIRCTAWAAPTGAINVTLAQTSDRNSTPPGAIVLTSGTVTTVTTVTTLTSITNWGNIVDNAAFTDGTTRISMGGYIFDEVAGTALTENDGAAARIDSKRSQVFSLEDATTRGTRLSVIAEDAPSTSGDTGIIAMNVRNDAQTTLTSTDADYGAPVVDGAGNRRTVGNVNSAATDSGSPIKTGTKYNATLPTVTDGQRVDSQGTSRGLTLVSLGDTLAGEDQTNNLMKVSAVGGLMPTNTALNTYAVRITTNTTTTPTSSTAYISSIIITTEVAGTTSTVTIRDKQGTPQVLVNGLTTTAASLTPTVLNFQTPVKMTSGIDVVTAGAVAGTVDIWINYYA